MLLPVEIVNKVLEYSVCYDIYEVHLYKIYNVFKIKRIGWLNKYDLGNKEERINKIKESKYIVSASNYGEDIYDDINKVTKIVKTVPINIAQHSREIILSYNYNSSCVIWCNICKQFNDEFTPYGSYCCMDCDFSKCNEIFKLVVYN